MKIAVVIPLALCMNILMAANGQKISLSEQSSSLHSVIREIKNQSGYGFICSKENLKKANLVTIELAGAELTDALDAIFAHQPLKYTIDNGVIIVIPKEEKQGELIPPGATLSGTIRDDKGAPLPKASIQLKGTSIGTVTNAEGKFTLTSPKNSGLLVISYAGFTSQEIAFSADANLDIVLQPKIVASEEIVVSVGFGTLKKKEVTTAVTHLDPKDLSSVAGNSGPLMSMQGKVPGLSISNTATADPNAEPNVQLQGVSSRSAGLGPLYVVNGVPGASMLNINQNDIASIDVLQGGAASAIYGTRGANGVILITTKKGTNEPQVLFDSYLSLDYITDKLKVLSRDQFLQHHLGIDYGYNTDWLKAVSNIPALGQKHTIQFSGGAGRTNYIASIDYKTSEGVDIRANRKEYGGRINVSHQSKNKLLNLNFNVAPRFISYNNANYDAFVRALTLSPTLSTRDTTDPTRLNNIRVGYISATNPLDNLTLVKDQYKILLLDLSASARVNILRNLFSTITLGESYINSNRRQFTPSNSVSAMNFNTATGTGLSTASQNLDVTSIYNFDWTGNYSLRIKNHSLDLLGGYSYAYYDYNGFNASNANFPSNLLMYNNLGGGLYNNTENVNGTGSYQNDSKLIAFFGRLNYNFDGKYYISASLRHEGSSKFGTANQWGNFPGISGAWRIGEERFMKQIGWLNELKLRGDYGVTGNQDFSAYQSLSLYTGYGYYPFNGAQYQVYGPSQTANADLRWEKTISYNIGLDFSILKNRVNGSFNYYIKKNQDLLGSYTIPTPPAVIGTVEANVGSMKNWGLQVQVDAVVISKKDLSYTISLAGASLGNKFLSFSNQVYIGQSYVDEVNMSPPGSPGMIQRLQEGKRIGSFFMKKFAGISSTGAVDVYTAKGAVTGGDSSSLDDRRFIGNGLPKYTMSLGNSITYKSFDLSVYFRGAFGYKIFNTPAFYIGTPVQQPGANVLTSAFDPSSKYSRITNQATYSTLSDYFLENGNWLKLDNVTVGYTYKFNNPAYVRSIRLYVTGRNLHTFTSYTSGDPEMVPVNGLTPGVNSSISYYPATLQLIAGVQVNF